MLSVLATVCVLGTILLCHEFGHFIAALGVRMRVLEFSIGAGRPVLFSWKRGDTVFNLRPFLFLGFVRLAGLDPEEDRGPLPDGFYDRSPAQRMLVLAAGGGMNILLAILLFWVEGLTFGLPVKEVPVLAQVVAGSPAAQAGLQPGDRLVGLDDTRSNEIEVYQRIVEAHPDRPLTVYFLRGGVEQSATVTPRRETGKGYSVGRIGVLFGREREKHGFLGSIRLGIVHTYQVVAQTITRLAMMLLRKLPVHIGGPVMIVQSIQTAAQSGVADLIDQAAMLSIAIGLLNLLLPIPGLDCGRLLFALAEWIIGRPINRSFEAAVHALGMLLLLGLIVWITGRELGQLWGAG